jgi:hypothetical protein
MKMTNIVPLFGFLRVLICGCGNETFIIHVSSSGKFTLVCTDCEHGINGYNVTKEESSDG